MFGLEIFTLSSPSVSLNAQMYLPSYHSLWSLSSNFQKKRATLLMTSWTARSFFRLSSGFFKLSINYKKIAPYHPSSMISSQTIICLFLWFCVDAPLHFCLWAELAKSTFLYSRAGEPFQWWSPSFLTALNSFFPVLMMQTKNLTPNASSATMVGWFDEHEPWIVLDFLRRCIKDHDISKDCSTNCR